MCKQFKQFTASIDYLLGCDLVKTWRLPFIKGTDCTTQFIESDFIIEKFIIHNTSHIVTRNKSRYISKMVIVVGGNCFRLPKTSEMFFPDLQYLNNFMYNCTIRALDRNLFGVA